MSVPPEDHDLELLAVTLMDVRSTTEALRRSVTNAQSSVEQFRHDSQSKHLKDIADCLHSLRTECGILTESAVAAEEPLKALLARRQR